MRTSNANDCQRLRHSPGRCIQSAFTFRLLVGLSMFMCTPVRVVAGIITVSIDDFAGLDFFASLQVGTPFGQIHVSGNESTGAVPGGSGTGLRNGVISTSSLNGGVATSIRYNYGGFSGGFQGVAGSRFSFFTREFFDDDTLDSTPGVPVGENQIGGPFGPVITTTSGPNGPVLTRAPFDSFSFFDPFAARADIDNVQITIEPAVEILRNPKSLRVNTSLADPAEITAAFSPVTSFGHPVPLELLARALDVDHFNWLQTIEQYPAGVLSFRADLMNDDIGVMLSQPELDPAVFLPERTLIVDTRDNLYYLVALPGIEGLGFVPDDRPFYYNEVGSDVLIEYGNFFLDTPEVETWTDVFNLEFFDAPRSPFFKSGDSIKFRTELVGVKDDGSFDQYGVGFTWRTNAAFVPGGQFTGLTFPKVTTTVGIPEVSSGGVFDVQVLTSGQAAPVPEPSSLILFGLGSMCVGVGSARRRRKARAIELN